MDEGRGDRLVRWAPLGLLSVCLLWITSKAFARISDPDDWWHLRLGNDLLHRHSLSAPPWSSYADQSWVPTEPVPEMVAALVQRWLGYPGLAALFGVSLFVVTVAVYALNRQLAGPLAAVAVTAIALLPLYGSMTSRPQLVSFVFLPVFIGAWIRTEQDLQPRWWLVALAWLWSLCHGFWFIGVAYGFAGLVAVAAGRRASGRQLARLAALAVATFVVVLLNPVGPGVLEAPFRVNDTSRYITEWQHPDPLAPGPLGAWLMIGVTLVVWVSRRRGVTPLRVLLVVSAVFWTWYAERTVIVAAIAIAPVLAGALHAAIQPTTTPVGEPGRLGRPEWKVIGATFALAVVGLAVAVPHTSREPGAVPLALDSQLDRVRPGSGVVSAYVLGGWIAWRHPDLDQYIDGLATPYSRRHYEDFFRIENQGTGWYRLLLDSGVSAALVESDSSLAGALEDRGWVRRGTSEGYVLLTRSG
jgi:hypothetical protein